MSLQNIPPCPALSRFREDRGRHPAALAAVLTAFLTFQRPCGAADGKPSFAGEILPVLREFCFDCHGDGSKKGGVSLDSALGSVPLSGDPQSWLAVWRNVDARLMPPPEKPQPTPAHLALRKRWLETDVFHVDAQNPDPGRIPAHRLNREEYRNTIQDLLGVDFPTDIRFPVDDSGNGFDNNADVLSLSPLLMEKYLEAARRIVLQWAAGSPSGQRGVFRNEPLPQDPAAARAAQRDFLQRFAYHAFRRPVEGPVWDQIAAACAREPDLHQGLQTGMMLILSSPRFLFRTEPPPAPGTPGPTAPVDEFALASRLSYFLWGSCPDARLLELAAGNTLRTSLKTEVERMLRDGRFKRFSRTFGGQWLQTRDTVSVSLSVRSIVPKNTPKDFEKNFNTRTRGLLRQETELLLQHLLSENRPVEELLTANYTFLNKTLAEFYQIPGVTQSDFVKVPLPADSHRMGLLTHGSFLMVTSNPTRTSPVKRGLFVLDTLLGTPTPPPPPNVPPLDEKKAHAGKLTMRQAMEQHREDALCASCHARMDPIGLALENFNAIGQYRESSEGSPIDTAGKLATGETFASIPELIQILTTSRKGDFYRRVSEKMLTYAIGRSLEYYDTPTINHLVETLHAQGGGWHSLLHAVIESAPFQKQRVNAPKVAMDATRDGTHTPRPTLPPSP
jgi:hypothetical protein